MHLKCSFWNMIRLYWCTIIIFTIKYNQGQFIGGRCRQHILKLSKIYSLELQKTSVYDHSSNFNPNKVLIHLFSMRFQEK